MPLPKLPEPVIAERRYFARIEEPLALTMEHDTEALGTDNLDHVVSRPCSSCSSATASSSPGWDTSQMRRGVIAADIVLR